MVTRSRDTVLAETLARSHDGPPTAPPGEVPAVRGRSLGRYLLLSELGAGAMGIVYAAYDPELDRRVALKLLKHPIGDRAAPRKRLQREAQALARLDHPNVVAVYDVGVHDDHLFIAMEFVAGKTLATWMSEAEAVPTPSGRFGAGAPPRVRPWREVLAVFAQAGRGLAAAHEVGLVHRDVKPDNVMLSADGRVRVMDFGLARAGADEALARADANAPLIDLTHAGAIVGTPAYMSLEQFETKDVDARSDQFSFCVALYEALYGERPFVGETLAELVTALQTDAVRPAPRGAAVPAWVRAVVLRGLARDPAARFASMRELLDALAADPVARRRRRALRVGLALAFVVGAWVLVALSLRLVRRDATIAEQRQEIGEKDAELARRLAEQTELLSVQRGLRATMLIPEAREAEALLLAIQAVGQYADDWDRAPREALAGLEQVLARDTVIITDERVLRGHRDYITAAEYSPDGARLATAARDGTARLWDPATGALVATLAIAETSFVDVAFAPDGTRLATAGEGGAVHLWRADTGEAIARGEGHGGRIGEILFSPDGARLATAGSDGGVRLRDGATGALLSTLRDPGGKPIVLLRFSPDGSRIAAGGESATIWVWDTSTGALVSTFTGHTDVVLGLAFAPNGARVASVSRDRRAYLWDPSDGRTIATLEGHGDVVTSVAYAPDGSHLATVGFDNVGRLYDPDTGALLRELRGGHSAGLVGLAYGLGGARLVTTSYEGSVTAWDPATGAVVERLVGHPSDVWAIDAAPDGRHIVTGGVDGTARIWDLGYPRVAMRAGPERDVQRFAFLPGHARVVTLDSSRRARVWDATSGAVLATLGDAGVHAIAASPDGVHVATLDRTALRVWDAATGEVTAERPAFPGAEAIFYAPDGARLYARSPDALWIFDAVTVEPAGNLALGRGMFVHAFSPDGAQIVIKTDGEPRVWDAHHGRPIAALAPLERGADQLAWSPDGAQIAVVHREGVSLWSARSYTRVARCEGHHGLARGLAFSPDGARLLAISNDAGAKIWDARTCALLAAYAPDEQNPKTGRGLFTPDGRVVLLSDRIVRVWDPGSSTVRMDLDGHDAKVEDALLSPDGARLITLSGRTLRTWELEKGALVSRDRIGVVAPGGEVTWPTHPRDLTRLACARLRMHGRVAEAADPICAPLLDPPPR